MADYKMSAGSGEHKVTGSEIGKPQTDPACSGCAGITHTHTCDDPTKTPKLTDTIQYWTDEYLKLSAKIKHYEAELEEAMRMTLALRMERDAARGIITTIVFAVGGSLVIPKKVMDELAGKRITVARLPQDDGGILFLTSEVEKQKNPGHKE